MRPGAARHPIEELAAPISSVNFTMLLGIARPSHSVADPDPARGREAPTCAYAILVPATVPVAAMARVPTTVMPTTIVPMPMMFAATVMNAAMMFADTVVNVAMMFAATMMDAAVMFAATMMTAAMMFATVATAMPSKSFGWQHQGEHNS
jgi:hypothetical protein